jgi:hypothetical protein
MTKLSCSDFAKHVLNTPLWPKQEEILDEYFGGKRVMPVGPLEDVLAKRSWLPLQPHTLALS